MTLFKNSFETGLSNGTTLTTGNSANGTAGTAFTNVVGTVHTFDNSVVMHGGLSMKSTNIASGNTYYDWVGLSGQNTLFALRFYIYVPTLPTTTDEVLCYIRGGATGTTGVGPLLLRTNNTLKIQSDAAGGASIFNTTGGFTAATWYRIEIYGQSNTTTTGEIHLRVYAGDSGSAISAMTADSTTANLGASVTIGTIRWGRGTALGQALNTYRDDLAFQTGSMTPIGAEPTNLNKLKSGANNALLKVGTNAVSKAYAGTTQIWP